MNNDPKDRETVLAEASRSIRNALQAQRQQLVERLRPDPAGRADFPRSVTMRLLMRRPARSAAWLAMMVRSRIGGPLLALLALAFALRTLRMAPLMPPAAISAPTRPPNTLALGALPRPR